MPNQAMELINDFYESQRSGSTNFPEDMFATVEVAAQVKLLLGQRGMAYGAYISHRRTGTNRRIMFRNNGKRESLTYTCMVTVENGKTRETLVLERYGDSEAFRITSYVIDNIPILHKPEPGEIA